MGHNIRNAVRNRQLNHFVQTLFRSGASPYLIVQIRQRRESRQASPCGPAHRVAGVDGRNGGAVDMHVQQALAVEDQNRPVRIAVRRAVHKSFEPLWVDPEEHAVVQQA